MRRKNLWPYLSIFALLLLLFSLSKGTNDKLRSAAAAISSPIWLGMAKAKSWVSGSSSADQAYQARLLELGLENQTLKKELEKTHQLIQEVLTKSSDRLHNKSLNSLNQSRLAAVPADVIYRAPTTWNSSVWINKGRSANRELGHEIIEKNSPVVVGSALVGVIDYVGEQQSRVRLITDAELTVAVRAARGYPQQLRLAESLDSLISYFLSAEQLGLSPAQKKQALQQFKGLQKLLLQPQDAHLLAKGELHGSSAPLWRSKGQLLKGIGFNYDFADEEGPARDLRSGIPFGLNDPTAAIQILKEKDLLVTTGMDGVFPAGLQVAEVVSIAPLEEGDYTYDLLAKPVAGNLDELSLLFVMPAIGYEF